MTFLSGLYNVKEDLVFLSLGPLLHYELNQAAMPVKELHVLPPFGRAMFGIAWIVPSVFP